MPEDHADPCHPCSPNSSRDALIEDRRRTSVARTYINHVIIGLDQARCRTVTDLPAELFFATAAEARHPVERWTAAEGHPQEAGRCGPRAQRTRARAAMSGIASAMRWPRKTQMWWRCTTATSQPIHVKCWRGWSTRSPIPAFPYQFCKGYYPRIARRQAERSRVSRLLVSPLLLSIQKVCGHLDYVEYLKGFRYPLAGEFAMRVSMLPDMRIPSDWGLEIGVLSEVWRNLSNRSVCQVDISDAYDHKHQDLSKDRRHPGPVADVGRYFERHCSASSPPMAWSSIWRRSAPSRPPITGPRWI
jgi:hypothetical protein